MTIFQTLPTHERFRFDFIYLSFCLLARHVNIRWQLRLSERNNNWFGVMISWCHPCCLDCILNATSPYQSFLEKFNVSHVIFVYMRPLIIPWSRFSSTATGRLCRWVTPLILLLCFTSDSSIRKCGPATRPDSLWLTSQMLCKTTFQHPRRQFTFVSLFHFAIKVWYV